MEPLALYIHWPFCTAKCPYCDFNSHVRERVDQAAFRAALRRELAFEAARANGTGPRRPLVSIFFGGGTPSLMEPETAALLIEDARALFDAAPDIEITLEANPTSVEAAKLRAFREAGVNRASLGVQALREDQLRFLGRRHDAAQAIAALDAARAIFPRLSFDLIYARPGQDEADWRRELREALALAADHLSLYQLTIEPGTRFATEYARGAFVLPDGDEAARLYWATTEEAARFGLAPYEVSNYAKPGAESRHNLQYWRYGDYLGIGPGAHQRLSCPQTPGGGSAALASGALAPARRSARDAAEGTAPVVVASPQAPGAAFAAGAAASGGIALLASRRHRAPEEWLARVARDGHAITEEESLTPQDRAREALLMGLRLAEGVDPARIAARSSLAWDQAVDPAILAACLEEGYLDWTAAGRLCATAEGRLRLDALLPALLR